MAFAEGPLSCSLLLYPNIILPNTFLPFHFLYHCILFPLPVILQSLHITEVLISQSLSVDTDSSQDFSFMLGCRSLGSV